MNVSNLIPPNVSVVKRVLLLIMKKNNVKFSLVELITFSTENSAHVLSLLINKIQHVSTAPQIVLIVIKQGVQNVSLGFIQTAMEIALNAWWIALNVPI